MQEPGRMYVASLQQGRTRVEPRATLKTLNAWLDNKPDQLWIDLQDPTAEQLAWIRGRFHLHPLAIEECDHTGVRPKTEEFRRHLYLVMHGINHNPGADALDTVEFKIFLWKKHLITVHDKPSTSIRATQERLKEDPELFSQGGVDTLLHRILDAVVDHYFPVVEQMEEQMETLEEEIFREPQHRHLEEMLRLQRRFLTLQRLIHPQLDVLGALSSGRFSEIEPEDLAYFRDVYDHLCRINDRTHMGRELLTGAMQCYLSQVSNRMNSVMKSLAVMATLAIPASFVTGLFGMNLEHLPGRGSPTTFWEALGISAALGLLALLVLRRLRWL